MSKNSKGEDDISVPILNVFFEESDRGCVLAGAAFLDDDLKDLLRLVFYAKSEFDEKDVEHLLTKRPKPPLESTWLKTEIACAFGYFPKHVRNAINSVGKLRNKFAHKSGYRVLKDRHVQGILDHLKPFAKDVQHEIGNVEWCMKEVGVTRIYSQARLNFMASILVLQKCCHDGMYKLD